MMPGRHRKYPLDAHCHLVLGQFKVGMPYLRDNAGSESEAYGAGVVLGQLSGCQYLVQRSALIRFCAGGFIHEVDAGHAASGVGVFMGVYTSAPTMLLHGMSSISHRSVAMSKVIISPVL